jgi:large subunit ribosomal protein L23
MAFFDRFKKHGDKSPKAKAEPKAKDTSVVKEKAAAPKIEPPKDSVAHRVLMYPIVSEKTARLEPKSQYVFAVARTANKVEIKKAVEQHYRVHVTGVNVVNVSGKAVRYGRSSGTRKDWRKAYVRLKKGETIVY